MTGPVGSEMEVDEILRHYYFSKVDNQMWEKWRGSGKLFKLFSLELKELLGLQ